MGLSLWRIEGKDGQCNERRKLKSSGCCRRMYDLVRLRLPFYYVETH
jgi:hypothetical protein